VGGRAGGAALTGRPSGPPRGSAALRRLLAGPPDAAARGLVGCLLSAGGVTVRLTETEAYSGAGEDPASHAHRGRTARNAAMFGPAGYAYVYFTYGMHWCLNVVCGPQGQASAVLLRAGAVVDGVEAARARRRSARRDADLARGPARLCAALGIDRSLYGANLLDGSGPALLSPWDLPILPEGVAAGPRVGVTGAHERPWRFWLDGDPTVSAYRRHIPRSRTAPAASPRSNSSG
jgi:DNA-3-methyladenine glycosylase